MIDEPEDLEDDEEDEELSLFDRAAEEGDEVYCHYWQTLGRPGGTGNESVYRLDGQYYSISEDYESAGPYPTLAAALDANEPLTWVTGTTISFESSLMDDKAIIERLHFTGQEQEEGVAGEHRYQSLLGDHADARLGDDREFDDAEEEYLIDGKEIRINQTRYEFRAPGTLIPLGPAPDDADDPSSESWDAEDEDIF